MITNKTIQKLESFNIETLYTKGESTESLSKKFKVSTTTIRQYLRIKGVPIRSAKNVRTRSLAPKGSIFGLWTVISDEVKTGKELNTNSKSRTSYWLCQCICGNISWKNSSHLKNGSSTRCKNCGNKSYLKDGKFQIINSVVKYKVEQTLNNIPNRIHRGNKKELTFNLSLDFMNDLFEKQGRKCALSGLSLEPDLSLTMNKQFMSIDRIDSNGGYEEDNVQWVDKRINMMKGSLSNEEFIELCTHVAKFNNKI